MKFSEITCESFTSHLKRPLFSAFSILWNHTFINIIGSSAIRNIPKIVIFFNHGDIWLTRNMYRDGLKIWSMWHTRVGQVTKSLILRHRKNVKIWHKIVSVGRVTPKVRCFMVIALKYVQFANFLSTKFKNRDRTYFWSKRLKIFIFDFPEISLWPYLVKTLSNDIFDTTTWKTVENYLLDHMTSFLVLTTNLQLWAIYWFSEFQISKIH